MAPLVFPEVEMDSPTNRGLIQEEVVSSTYTRGAVEMDSPTYRGLIHLPAPLQELYKRLRGNGLPDL